MSAKAKLLEADDELFEAHDQIKQLLSKVSKICRKLTNAASGFNITNGNNKVIKANQRPKIMIMDDHK